MRYHLIASFKEEQCIGFIVTHTIEKEFEKVAELSDAGNSFLQTYDSRFCHSMNYHVTESKRNQ